MAVVKGDSQALKKKEEVSVTDEIDALTTMFGQVYERDIVKLNPVAEGEIGNLILSMEEEAQKCGPWLCEPKA